MPPSATYGVTGGATVTIVSFEFCARARSIACASATRAGGGRVVGDEDAAKHARQARSWPTPRARSTSAEPRRLLLASSCCAAASVAADPAAPPISAAKAQNVPQRSRPRAPSTDQRPGPFSVSPNTAASSTRLYS